MSSRLRSNVVDNRLIAAAKMRFLQEWMVEAQSRLVMSLGIGRKGYLHLCSKELWMHHPRDLLYLKDKVINHLFNLFIP